VKKICYRIGTGPCQTGWVDTANCTDPNIYSLAIGGVAVAGAIESPCGDCPATSTDGEFVVRAYTATAAGPGYAIGNSLEMRQAYDMSVAPPAPIGTPVWTNLTTGLVVTPAPVMATLSAGSAASGGTGLTDTQLRATPVPVSTAVTVRTAAMQSGVVAAGSVAAGAYEVGFKNDGTTNATVAGGTLVPGATVSFVTHGNDTFAAIAYTASATSALTIVTVR
jgi:hypothetical protein